MSQKLIEEKVESAYRGLSYVGINGHRRHLQCLIIPTRGR